MGHSRLSGPPVHYDTMVYVIVVVFRKWVQYIYLLYPLTLPCSVCIVS